MITQSDFNPPAWLRNPHLQTLWPYLLRAGMKIAVRRERLELADGDFIDLDWNACDDGPIVVVLHGLSGSIKSHYAKCILRALQRCGIRGALMNFRGASGEPNRLARGYHAGETGDFSAVLQKLQSRDPRTPIAAVGYSLGGNVLLKWLGEQGDCCCLTAAVAVSVPLDLDATTQRLSRGFSRLYQRHILKCLKRDILIKTCLVDMPVDTGGLDACTVSGTPRRTMSSQVRGVFWALFRFPPLSCTPWMIRSSPHQFFHRTINCHTVRRLRLLVMAVMSVSSRTLQAYMKIGLKAGSSVS